MICVEDSRGNFIRVNGEGNYFPDGTPAFNTIRGGKVTPERDSCRDIYWKFDNMSELFEVVAINDWLKSFNCTATLYMPYIPNARMDRVKDRNDVFTLKTFCNIINSCNFEKVVVQSAHSYVSLALLNSVINEEPVERFIECGFEDFDVIFFPDEGALKRFSELEIIKNYPIVFANKKRDWKTGKITGLDIVGEDVKGKKVLFIDDLISRGGSLLYSTKELLNRGATKVIAFITHTENVIDTESLKEAGVSKIYTTDSIYRGNNSLIEVI